MRKRRIPRCVRRSKRYGSEVFSPHLRNSFFYQHVPRASDSATPAIVTPVGASSAAAKLTPRGAARNPGTLCERCGSRGIRVDSGGYSTAATAHEDHVAHDLLLRLSYARRCFLSETTRARNACSSTETASVSENPRPWHQCRRPTETRVGRGHRHHLHRL